MRKFIMMVGLPASGKSTVTKEISIQEKAVVHSSDSLRKELFGDENTNDKNEELFKELHNRIKTDLRAGKNVIYDATNINYKRRKAFLEELKNIDCEKICYLIATPYEKCLKQNNQRERKVPEHVIRKMYLNFDIPAYFERWDKIEIIYNGLEEDYLTLFERLDEIKQDNPNHTFTIGMHCKVCSVYVCNSLIEKRINDESLIASSLYHDIGKEFTKQFKNAKGEDTDIAHYYNHHNISAYKVLFLLKDKDYILDTCQLIRWHMQPFFIETKKAKNKFINLVGQEFYDKLMVLHEADVKAH